MPLPHRATQSMTRRGFLSRTLGASLGTSALAALCPGVPLFLARSSAAAEPDAGDGRLLVVVELDGGNDGINTVVPYADDGYGRHRKALRLPKDRLIRLDDHLGLHPALRGMARLWEAGRLAVVQGVGYPNPSRSHFQSMAAWRTGRPDQREQTGLGWIGQALDGRHAPADGAVAASVGMVTMPAALVGRRAAATSIHRPEQFALPDGAAVFPAAGPAGQAPGEDLRQFVARTSFHAVRTAERLREMGKGDAAAEKYPATALARQLQLTARLIRADLGFRVFYTQQSGYDTHSGQLPQHDSLLRELGDALSAFFADLDAAGLTDRVVVMAFSEFGRRVAENTSQGTDHGTAGPVFLAGPAVRGGIAGSSPSLGDLEDGDLKTAVDFRSVYATVLQRWLGLPARDALAGSFRHMPLFRPS